MVLLIEVNTKKKKTLKPKSEDLSLQQIL